MRFFGRRNFNDLVFYGPHRCRTCNQMICKASFEQGGEEYDYPSGPIYPNTRWERHACPGHWVETHEPLPPEVRDRASRQQGYASYRPGEPRRIPK